MNNHLFRDGRLYIYGTAVIAFGSSEVRRSNCFQGIPELRGRAGTSSALWCLGRPTTTQRLMCDQFEKARS